MSCAGGWRTRRSRPASLVQRPRRGRPAGRHTAKPSALPSRRGPRPAVPQLHPAGLALGPGLSCGPVSLAPGRPRPVAPAGHLAWGQQAHVAPAPAPAGAVLFALSPPDRRPAVRRASGLGVSTRWQSTLPAGFGGGDDPDLPRALLRQADRGAEGLAVRHPAQPQRREMMRVRLRCYAHAAS